MLLCFSSACFKDPPKKRNAYTELSIQTLDVISDRYMK